jgi:hypothetical protein
MGLVEVVLYKIYTAIKDETINLYKNYTVCEVLEIFKSL